MARRSILTLSILISLPGMADAGLADVSCDDSARMTQTLTRVLGAERQGGGLRDPQTMLEIWITPRDGSWLVVQTYTNGTSCIVAMGEHWEGDLTGPA